MKRISIIFAIGGLLIASWLLVLPFASWGVYPLAAQPPAPSSITHAESAPTIVALVHTATLTQVYTTALPMVLRNEPTFRLCSTESPFSIEIARLHLVVPGAGSSHTHRALTESEWLALLEESFPTLPRRCGTAVLVGRG